MSEVLTKLVVYPDGTQAVIPLTTEEIAQRELDIASAEERRVAEEAAQAALDTLKASAKAKLVAGEPLTAEEAELVVI